MSTADGSPIIVVTGANGFVGSRVCALLAERGASVRALVRRPGTAPRLTGVQERVGAFDDPAVAAAATSGAQAVVTTVHPMGSDWSTQHRIGVEGTAVLAGAARDAGATRLVHISTAAVYDRSPGTGDVDESSPLVPDAANAYAVSKRDADLALAGLDRLTRVLVRPPAILGPGRTSVWNSVRPAAIRAEQRMEPVTPEQTFAWVHVDDLVRFVADVATGRVRPSTDPGSGPVEGGCVAVNLAAHMATARDYFSTVGAAVGVEPVWSDAPAWTGRLLTGRAAGWGWAPTVELPQALAELEAGLRT